MSGVGEKAAFCVEPSGLAREQLVERRDEGGGLCLTEPVIDRLSIARPPLRDSSRHVPNWSDASLSRPR